MVGPNLYKETEIQKLDKMPEVFLYDLVLLSNIPVKKTLSNSIKVIHFLGSRKNEETEIDISGLNAYMTGSDNLISDKINSHMTNLISVRYAEEKDDNSIELNDYGRKRLTSMINSIVSEQNKIENYDFGKQVKAAERYLCDYYITKFAKHLL